MRCGGGVIPKDENNAPGLYLAGMDLMRGGQLGHPLLTLDRLQRHLGPERWAVLPSATEQGVHLSSKEDVLDYLLNPRPLLSGDTLERRKTFHTSSLKRIPRNGDEVEI
jgi:hypothetical protein